MNDITRVLVVDDFLPVRNIIANRLSEQGYRVATAENGPEAVEICRKERPDLAIVDWTVPFRGGVGLVNRIKADPSLASTYVILLIARTDVEGKVEALEVGADEYLVKPIAEAELLARVRAATRIIATQRRLERLARTDGLTGVANRRAFQEDLHREVSRSHRYGRPLSLVMMDIDDFKRINDSFGHLLGDEVLKMAAASLVAHCRDSDTVARLGGDEFAVILPETDEAGAQATIRRLTSTLEAEWNRCTATGEIGMQFAAISKLSRRPDLSLRLSMGWATSSTGRQLSPSELVHTADMRMYENKRRLKTQYDPEYQPNAE